LLPILAALAMMDFTVSGAFAHALGAECKLTNDTVSIEAYFDDDTSATDAKVVVTDEAGSAVASGRTDKEGRWTFPAPAPGRYRVRVDAGDGHATTVSLRVPGEVKAPTPAATVSEGQTREEFTRTPWVKLGIGLGAIGLMAAGYAASRRRAVEESA
jgi:hypothetical protein